MTITSPAGVSVSAGNQINTAANPASSVVINGNALSNSGEIDTQNLTINATGTLTFTTAGTGKLSTPLQSFNLGSTTGGITIAGALPAANTFNFTALKGAVNFGKTPNTIAAVTDGSGNGGTINISALTLTATPLTLNAPASGTGAGGHVSINLTGTTAVKVATGAIVINAANSGGGAGGSVTITDNANVTVDAKSMLLGSGWAVGNGADLTLAGKIVHVSNSNLFDNAGLHNLSITSNTSSFTVGGASSSANGFGNTSATLKADNITLINNGGTIIKGTNTGIIATTDITLKTKTDIGQTGTKALIINAPNASLIAGGSLYVNDTNLATTFSSLQALTTLQLTAGLVTAPAAVNAKTLALTLGSIGAFTTTATTITAAVTAGDLNITDSATALLNLNALKSGGNVIVSSGGAVTAKSTITAPTAVSLTSNGALITKGIITAGTNVTVLAKGTKGSISEGANITAGAGVGNTISLTASGTGTTGTIIDAGSGTYEATANTISLTTNGANVGTTSVGFRTGNAASLATVDISATTGGNTGAVNITNKDTNAAGVVSLTGTTNVGSFKLTATNGTSVTTNTGTLNVGAITAKTGAVFITTSEQNLTTNGAISTTNGNITLQDTHSNAVAPLPQITIGGNIHGSSTGSTSTGNVFIAIGTVPTSGTVRPGTPPANVSIVGTKVTFGTSTNTTGSISIETNNTNILTSSGRNLAFTTGSSTSKPSQIVLNTGVNITADPPPGVASTGAPLVSANLAAISAAPISSLSISGTASPQANQIIAPAASSFASGGGFNPALSNAATLAVSGANGTAINVLNNAGDNVASAGTSNGTAAFSNSAVYSDNVANDVAVNTLSGSAVVNKMIDGANPHRGGSEASTKDITRQTLDKGAFLLAPDHNTVVDTPYGPVSVAAGAVALLVSFDKGLAVYDLHDGRKGAVVVGSGPQCATLVPGRSAVLTKTSVTSFEEINPAQLVGYRKLTSKRRWTTRPRSIRQTSKSCR